MRAIEHSFRRNFVVALVMHVGLIAGIVFCEGFLFAARKTSAEFVQLITPGDILGELPKGPGMGRGEYAPPSEPVRSDAAAGSNEAIFTPEERPAPQPKAAPQSATDRNDIFIPKQSTPKPQVKTTQTTPKPSQLRAKPTATKTTATSKLASKPTSGTAPAVSADAIRQRFAKALATTGDGTAGTPYGDGKRAGGGTGNSSAIGSPDGSPFGVVGGIGKGTPFWWYYQQVHDKMYEAWEQPGQALNWDKGLMATVMIRVARDGRITDVSLKNSSGNKLMDNSALAAARRVLRLDPLPQGLGGEFAEISVNFQLES